MKKYITERKWDKLYDEATNGFAEKTLENGDEVYTKDGFDNYMKAVRDFPDYQIIGVRYQFSVLKDRIRDYKLRHLKIGKVKNLDKKKFTEFKIVNISWDVHWQMDIYLAVIIRDYLRFFIKNTPAIGNCVVEDQHTLMFGLEEEQERLSDEYSKKWHELVNSVADEFDELAKFCKGDYDDMEYQELEKSRTALKKKAFSDLAFIFDDLSW
jgi:hypothetical protein